VPRQIVKIEREEKEFYEPVGRVTPPEATPPGTVESAIAARLRPLDRSTQISPIATVAAASSPLGAGSGRSNDQLGLRATELQPVYSGGYSTTLPPANVARTPYQPLWR
jgi:hypothetical protein